MAEHGEIIESSKRSLAKLQEALKQSDRIMRATGSRLVRKRGKRHV